MIRKKAFGTNFPLLDEYFEENEKNVLNADVSFKLKYEACSDSLGYFINVLNRFYNEDDVSKILHLSFLKMDSNDFLNFISAFFNSNDEIKMDMSFVDRFEYLNTIGGNVLQYVVHNGIVSFDENIPEFILDAEYLKISSGKEYFREYLLSDYYNNFSVKEKLFINELLKNNSFQLLNNLFNDYNFSLVGLIRKLTKSYIDVKIINDKVIKKLNSEVLVLLIFNLMEKSSISVIDIINELLRLERYSVINYAVYNDVVANLSSLEKESIGFLSDVLIIKKIDNVEKN